MRPLFIPAVLITTMIIVTGWETLCLLGRHSNAKIYISAMALLELGAPLIIISYMLTGAAVLVPFFQLATIALMLLMLITAVLHHNPTESKDNFYKFMSHISITGGLLVLFMKG
jgi:uncharacterized membrane protein YphA (DoxX/SURF4 family)